MQLTVEALKKLARLGTGIGARCSCARELDKLVV
jgi:hypothetical protein